jgi:hypothetical protein
VIEWIVMRGMKLGVARDYSWLLWNSNLLKSWDMGPHGAPRPLWLCNPLSGTAPRIKIKLPQLGQNARFQTQ